MAALLCHSLVLHTNVELLLCNRLHVVCFNNLTIGKFGGPSFKFINDKKLIWKIHCFRKV